MQGIQHEIHFNTGRIELSPPIQNFANAELQPVTVQNVVTADILCTIVDFDGTTCPLSLT
jgi:hypothetical protein